MCYYRYESYKNWLLHLYGIHTTRSQSSKTFIAFASASVVRSRRKLDPMTYAATATRAARLLLLGGSLSPRRVLCTMRGSNSLRVTTTTDTPEAEQKLLEAVGSFAASQSVLRESIHSFYWWEGQVQSDPELRLSFETSLPLEDVLMHVGAAHNYDVPMIIADTVDAGSAHWKGIIATSDDGSVLAERLAASRLVACAQVASDGSVMVKTTAGAKAAVAERAQRPVQWVPITGNSPYLSWLETEVAASTSGGGAWAEKD